MIACAKGHTDIVKVLLSVPGINVNAKDKVFKYVYEIIAIS